MALASIHHKIIHGRLDRVKILIQQDRKLLEQRDAQGHTPIHAAAAAGQIHIVKYLLAQGVAFNVTDINHQTPLALAAAAGHDDTVDCLIAHGADVNFIPPAADSCTALDRAFVNGRTSTIDILHTAGARANFTYSTYKGKTLPELIRENSLTDVRVLVRQNPALLEEIDENGLKPVDLASSLGYVSIESYLILEQLALDYYPPIDNPSNASLSENFDSNAKRRRTEGYDVSFFQHAPGPSEENSFYQLWLLEPGF